MDTSDKSYFHIFLTNGEQVDYACPPAACSVQEQQILVYAGEGVIIGYPLHAVERYEINIVPEQGTH